MAFSFSTSKIQTDNELVTILSGQTESDSIDLVGATAVGIILPSTLTGATLTFLVGIDDQSFEQLRNETGTLIAVTFVANGHIGFTPSQITAFSAYRFVKVQSDLSEAANRDLTIIGRQL